MMDTMLTIPSTALLQDQKAEQLNTQAKVIGGQLTDAKRKELKKVAQDFEALFTGMMLKAMRSTVPEDNVTGGGRAEETFRSLLDQEYANAAAKQGGQRSLAAMVERELLRRYEGPQQANRSKPSGDAQ